MKKTRRPAGDLIEAVVKNLRENIEELKYTTIAPSRYLVYVSPAEYARLEGIFPRLRDETVRALNDELARLNARRRLRQFASRWLGAAPTVESADVQWHIEFLPDLDGELQDEHDILVHSELVLPPVPELGTGERTRKVKTVHSGRETARATTAASPVTPQTQARPHARLTYQDERGPQRYDLVRESTTIGRGGSMYPVDVRVATTDDVSREHARIRRDPTTGALFLIDLSSHGTSIDGRLVPRGFDDADGRKRENGVEVELPSRARIALAGTIVLEFERL